MPNPGRRLLSAILCSTSGATTVQALLDGMIEWLSSSPKIYLCRLTRALSAAAAAARSLRAREVRVDQGSSTVDFITRTTWTAFARNYRVRVSSRGVDSSRVTIESSLRMGVDLGAGSRIARELISRMRTLAAQSG